MRDRGTPLRRSLVILATLLAACLVVVDLRRAPHEQISNRVLSTSIRVYRATMSRPLAGLGVRCRFEPSCSRYAEACLRNRGAVAGSAAAARRLLRCGPWTPKGTVDPPPPGETDDATQE